MAFEETNDPTCNVLDISIDSSVNAEVFPPLKSGMIPEAPAERYTKRSAINSKWSSCPLEMAEEAMNWPRKEKIDKEIRIEPISSCWDKRTEYEKINDSLLNEEMQITGNDLVQRQIKSLEIQPLKYEYFKNDTILFKIPDHIISCDDWVRVKISLIWQRLEDELGTRLSLQLDNQYLSFSGTYSDSCTVCYFDAQVWKAEFGIWTERDYALEFRRTSLSGRQAFGILLQHVATGLKELGAAEQFGNGKRIMLFGDGLSDLDYMSCWESFTIDDLSSQSSDEDTEWVTAPRKITKDPEGADIDDLYIRPEELDYFQCDEPVSSLCSEPIEPCVSIYHKDLSFDTKKMHCMIQLGDDLFEIWRGLIEQRVYPAAGEAIRTLRMCCYDADIDKNVQAVRGNQALLTALCNELKLQSANVQNMESNMYTMKNAEVCINILEIIFEIAKSPSNDELLIENDILQLAAHCAYFFSGNMNMPELPVPRTTGIVLAALRILDILTTRQGRNLAPTKYKPVLEFLKLHPIDKRRDVDSCRTLLLKLTKKLRTLGQQL